MRLPAWNRRKNGLYGAIGAGMTVIAALLYAPSAAAADNPPETPASPAAETANSENTAPIPAPDTQPPPKKEYVQGAFSAGFDAETADGHSDFDLDQTLRLKVTIPNYEKLRLVGSLWTREDLDSDESQNSVLRTIQDSYDADLQARLLQLYAEFTDLTPDSILRFGRQRILEAPQYNRVDGLYFKKSFPKWDWYAFAGARASLYDDSHEDLMVGGGAGLQVTSLTRVNLDFMYAEDHRGQGAGPRQHFLAPFGQGYYPRYYEEDVSDTLLTLSLYQTITENLYAFSRFTLNNGDADEWLVDFSGAIPSWDCTYQFVYQRQMQRVEDRVNDLTVFYRIVGRQETYDLFLFNFYKPLSEKFVLSLETELRNSSQDSSYTANRDYFRQAIALSAANLFHGIDARVAVERWIVDGGEGTWAVTGEVSKRWNDLLLTVGADYERYKDRVVSYDPKPYAISQFATYVIPGLYPRYPLLVYATDEKQVELCEDLYTIYAKLRWSINKSQSLWGMLAFEEDDGPDSPYWRLKATYEIQF